MTPTISILKSLLLICVLKSTKNKSLYLHVNAIVFSTAVGDHEINTQTKILVTCKTKLLKNSSKTQRGWICSH